MSARKIYQNFHGRAVRFIDRLRFRVPESLVLLGKAKAIEYVCDKNNGGGDGTQAIYRHAFGKDTYLYCDEQAREQLYIIGAKIRVKREGITG